jgi:hypothetical protein
VQYRAALRFFFVKTLHRHYLLENIPLPKEPRPQTPAAYLKRSYRKCAGPRIRSRPSRPRRRTSDKIYRFSTGTPHFSPKFQPEPGQPSTDRNPAVLRS